MTNRSVPQPRYAILIENQFVGNQDQVLGLRLCNEHAIERILVRPRQVARALGMFNGDRERSEPFPLDLAREVLRERKRVWQLSPNAPWR